LEADERVDADREAQELRKKMAGRNGKGGGHGVRWCSYKALRQLIEGFWGTVLAICAAPNSPKRHMGRYLGFYATAAHVAHLSSPPFVEHRIITDFSAIN